MVPGLEGPPNKDSTFQVTLDMPLLTFCVSEGEFETDPFGALFQVMPYSSQAELAAKTPTMVLTPS